MLNWSFSLVIGIIKTMWAGNWVVFTVLHRAPLLREGHVIRHLGITKKEKGVLNHYRS
jgi:hypothetical protein